MYIIDNERALLRIDLNCRQLVCDKRTVKMIKSYKVALEYVNSPYNYDFKVIKRDKPLTKKQLNHLYKIINSIKTKFELSSFTIDCNIQFSRLINSMCTLPSIVFNYCDFDFEGDWKINKSIRYE